MDKRYQIFVSSTSMDLRDERTKVFQTLMEMGCLPARIKLSPTADEEQWSFVERVIDDCDYSLVILGDRYRSLTSEGIRSTERAYDYAVGRGIKVIAMIHEPPEQSPVGTIDRSPETVEALSRLRDKVSKGSLVKRWTQADQLPALVALSLSKTIKTYPAVGWARATASTEVLAELNEAGKRIKELEAKVAKLKGELQARAAAKYEGRTFKELVRVLAGIEVDFQWNDGSTAKSNLGDSLISLADMLVLGVSNEKHRTKNEREVFFKVAQPLLVYGLAELLPAPKDVSWQRIGLTAAGRHFVAEARSRIEQINFRNTLKELTDTMTNPTSSEHAPDAEEAIPKAPSDPVESAGNFPPITQTLTIELPIHHEPVVAFAEDLSGIPAKKQRTPPKGSKGERP